MKITSMSDSEMRQEFIDAVELEMEMLARKYGVTFSRGNGKYSDNAFTFTGMKFTVQETSTGVSGAEAEYKRLAPFGYKETYGKTLRIAGKEMKLVAIQTKAKKYPFIAEDVATGKRFKLTTEQVRIGLMV